MRRGTCRGCGHPVVFADYEDSVLVLEIHEVVSGPGRYAIFDDQSVHPVAAGREVLAYPLHVCEKLERLRREGGVVRDYTALH